MQVIDALSMELQLQFVSNLFKTVFPVHICLSFLKNVLFLLNKILDEVYSFY
jgi:hypothetical protein